MVTINSLSDLQDAQVCEAIDPMLMMWMENELTGLWEHLGQNEPLANFNLRLHGPLYVATASDKDMSWNELTANMSNCVPEFIEKYIFAGNKKAFRIGFLMDNDFLPMLYALADCLNPEVAEWLDGEADGCKPGNYGNTFPDIMPF